MTKKHFKVLAKILGEYQARLILGHKNAFILFEQDILKLCSDSNSNFEPRIFTEYSIDIRDNFLQKD